MSNAQDTAMAPATPSNYKSIQTNADTKTIEDFRTYTQDEDTPARVIEHYRDMRRFQTVEFYEKMEKKYSFESKSHDGLGWIQNQ